MSHDENFWINACLHMLFCTKNSLDCAKCAYIRREIDNEKPGIGEEGFVEGSVTHG